MQQLTSRDPAQKSGSAKKETLIIGKVQVQPQQRVSASELAVQPGMEFPSNDLPVVMDEEEGPLIVSFSSQLRPHNSAVFFPWQNANDKDYINMIQKL